MIETIRFLESRFRKLVAQLEVVRGIDVNELLLIKRVLDRALHKAGVK